MELHRIYTRTVLEDHGHQLASESKEFWKLFGEFRENLKNALSYLNYINIFGCLNAFELRL